MFHNKSEIVQVLFGQRRQLESAIRQIDPLIASKLFAPWSRMCNPGENAVRFNFFDRSANFSVVKPDTLAIANVLKYLWQGATDVGWTQYTAGGISSCLTPGP